MNQDKPTLLLDMDGPLAAFDTACWEVIRKRGWETDVAGEHEQTHRYVTDHLVNPAARKILRTIIGIKSGYYREGWFAKLPVTPGAQEHLPRLMELFDVWVCTKPLEDNITCRDDKAGWLREHFGGLDLERKLIIAPDKSMIRGHVLLDDAIKPAWVDQAEWAPVTFAFPFNEQGDHAIGPRWEWGDDPSILFDAAVQHKVRAVKHMMGEMNKYQGIVGDAFA